MNFGLIVRVWLIATLSIVAGLIVWELAPILFVIALVTVGLGGVAAGMIALARWLERRRTGGV